MNVNITHLPRLDDPNPRIGAGVDGLQVVWDLAQGWRCRCGKTAGAKRCRHVRAVSRALPDSVYNRLSDLVAHLGWSL